MREKPDGSQRPRRVWNKTRRRAKHPAGSGQQRKNPAGLKDPVRFETRPVGVRSTRRGLDNSEKTRRVSKTPSGLEQDPSACEAPGGVWTTAKKPGGSQRPRQV